MCFTKIQLILLGGAGSSEGGGTGGCVGDGEEREGGAEEKEGAGEERLSNIFFFEQNIFLSKIFFEGAGEERLSKIFLSKSYLSTPPTPTILVDANLL